MRLLLIEDDASAAESLELILRKAEMVSDVTDSGKEGIELAKLYDYDLIILDLTLPDIDGYEVLRKLRLEKIDTPTLILTGREGTEHKVKGFRLGADDYLTKPFHREELVARIRAIVRRSKRHAQSIIHAGPIVLNVDTKGVEVDGRRVHLTGKEFRMLELLARKKGMTVTKEMFLNHLYGGMDEPAVKIIDVFICKLRRKLAAAADGRSCVETIWGRGYTLRAPAQKANPPSPEVASA